MSSPGGRAARRLLSRPHDPIKPPASRGVRDGWPAPWPRAGGGTMTSYRIAVIPGDGIGTGGGARGPAGAGEGGRRASASTSRSEQLDWSCALLREARPDDARGRARADRRARRDLPRRRGLAERAGPRLALGPPDPDPPALRPVRQPAARAPVRGRALPAGGQEARRHRLPDRARELRGRIFGDRRPHLSRHRPGDGDPGIDLHPTRGRPDPALCLRAGPDAGRAST